MLSRISLRQLEYFVAVGNAGSIADASERICVSSSSISSAISHIENELSVQLFVRHHAQGISLTPVGRLVMREAQQILDLTANLYSAASEANGAVRGPLRVGCFVTLAALVAPELCQGFARANPAVQITQIEDHQEGLLDKLRHAEIDVAITYDLQVAGGDIEFEPLASLPPHVIVSETHPLANRRAVALEELAALPMVLLDLPLSREYFLSLFHAAGVNPDIRARTASQDVVRSLVANDIGYSLANIRPRASLALDGRKIVRVRLAGKHRPMMLGLAWLKGRQMSRVVEAFCHRCRSFISDEYIPGMSAPVYVAKGKAGKSTAADIADIEAQAKGSGPL